MEEVQVACTFGPQIRHVVATRTPRTPNVQLGAASLQLPGLRCDGLGAGSTDEGVFSSSASQDVKRRCETLQRTFPDRIDRMGKPRVDMPLFPDGFGRLCGQDQIVTIAKAASLPSRSVEGLPQWLGTQRIKGAQKPDTGRNGHLDDTADGPL